MFDFKLGDLGTIVALIILLFGGSFFGLWSAPGLTAILVFTLIVFLASFITDLIHASDKRLFQHLIFSLTIAVAIYIVIGLLALFGVTLPAVGI